MLKKTAGLFACGSVGYAALEILWRGHTHWTMALTGGTVFTAMAAVQKRLRDVGVPRRCLAGAALITTTEFIVGCVVNLCYQMDVWDYSREKLNFKGQICAKYAVLWLLLSAPAMCLADKITDMFPLPAYKTQKRLARGDTKGV